MFKNPLLIIFFLSSINTFSQETNSTNIILMIGDGMGISQISSGMYSNNNYTSFEKSEYVGLIKSHSADELVTDSAAAGTAMFSGIKTKNKVIGMDVNFNPVKSIFDICVEKGYSTAIIVTSTIVHATPASLYSSVESRYDYDEIASQLAISGINFFAGGGEKYFIDRDDERNLIDEMNDYFFADNLESFEKSTSNKIGYLTHYDDPTEKHLGRYPSLTDLVKLTIEKLENLNKPFLLLIEGSQIDWGGHDNDADHMISEMIEFDNTVNDVFNFSKEDLNTLVVVTSDHETGGTSIIDGNLQESEVIINYVSEDHTATMVPVFSLGPNSEKFKGVYDNTEIFNKLLEIVKQ